MLRVFKISMCLLISVWISGCSDNNSMPPKEVTMNFLEAFHEKSEVEILAFSMWDKFNVSSLSLQEGDVIDNVDEDLQENVYNMFLDFEHQEKTEVLNDDKACVTVELTMYQFDDVKKEAIDNGKKKAEELSNGDLDAQQQQAQIITTMYETLSKAPMTKTIMVDVNLEKKDAIWLVSDNNKDLLNALLANTNVFKDLV